MDTPEFQRLRSLRQVGNAYRVYGTCSHERFEHCIGTCELARRLLTSIDESQPNLHERGCLDGRDISHVVLAAAAHDLGHGPLSHVFESFIRQTSRSATYFNHETASLRVLEQVAARYGMSGEDFAHVGSMILGAPSTFRAVADVTRTNRDLWHGRVEPPAERTWLWDIVSNNATSFDVDKLDYLARDQLMATGACSVRQDYNRIFASCRVRPASFRGTPKICERFDLSPDDLITTLTYNVKVATSVFDVFTTRYDMFASVYYHKRVIAQDAMVVDALVAANPAFRFDLCGDFVTSDSALARYLSFNDGIFDRIANFDVVDARATMGLISGARDDVEKTRECLDVLGERTGTMIDVPAVCFLDKTAGEEALAGVERAQQLLRRWDNREFYDVLAMVSFPIQTARRYLHRHDTQYHSSMSLPNVRQRLMSILTAQLNQGSQVDTSHFTVRAIEFGVGKSEETPLKNFRWWAQSGDDSLGEPLQMPKTYVGLCRTRQYQQFTLFVLYKLPHSDPRTADEERRLTKVFNEVFITYAVDHGAQLYQNADDYHLSYPSVCVGEASQQQDDSESITVQEIRESGQSMIMGEAGSPRPLPLIPRFSNTFSIRQNPM